MKDQMHESAQDLERAAALQFKHQPRYQRKPELVLSVSLFNRLIAEGVSRCTAVPKHVEIAYAALNSRYLSHFLMVSLCFNQQNADAQNDTRKQNFLIRCPSPRNATVPYVDHQTPLV